MKKYPRHAIAVLMVLGCAVFGQSMGWLQNSTGTYEYDDTANWKDGIINGVFGTNLTSKSTQVLTFDSDFDVTSDTFRFEHPGEITFKFQSDGSGAVTATLQDDIEITPATAKGSITFGSSTSGEELNFDLGGETRTANITIPMVIRNSVSDGEFVITGSSFLEISGENATIEDGCSIAAEYGTTLRFGAEGDSDSGCLRASDVWIKAATLQAYARKYGSGSTDIVDTLTFAPYFGNGGTPAVYFRSSYKNENLHVNNIVRYHNGIINIDANSIDKLGTTDFSEGYLNFTVDNGIDLYGSGGAGETTCAVVPWARHNTYFMTYDSIRGFRVLDPDTERRTYSTNYVGSLIAEGENVYIDKTCTLVDFTNAVNVVNSFSTGYANADTWVYVTNGVLQVLSGGIMLDGNHTVYLDANIDFGNNRGYIVDRAGKRQYLRGSIAGNNGLTIANLRLSNSEYSGGTGFTVESKNNTFTGDFNLHGRILLSSSDFLPFGSRSGNTVIDGFCKLGDCSEFKMNGLFGTGLFHLDSSYTTEVILGDNNSDGDFGGNFRRKRGTLSLTKIGTGVQRFSGECSHNGDTVVEAGTLVVDGTHTGGLAYTVQTNATLAGSGTIVCQSSVSTAITVENGGILAPGSLDVQGTMTVSSNVYFEAGSFFDIDASGVQADKLAVNGTVTSEDIVGVKATVGTGVGPWMIMSATEGISATFEVVEGNAKLYKANGDTELWLEKIPEGSLFIIE